MRTLFTLFCLSLLFDTYAQKLLKGVVIDADKNVPVPKASIFLSNTSVGTSADTEGKFELSIPAGKYDLIVSSIGYQTHNQPVSGTEVQDFTTIKLKEKAPELEAVIIEPFEKDGWRKWGTWFIENFIGTSKYSKDCRIRNPEVLKFRNSRRTNDLTAIAIAPLVIENKALGYRITYQLESFRYDFTSRYLVYTGYPFFENLEGGERKRRQWEQARNDVYDGSLLHFMRALYRNQIIQEGFEMRRLVKKPNTEKQRIRMVYKTSRRVEESGRMISTIKKDSSAYYDHILAQPDYTDILYKEIIPGDSIAYGVDSTTAEMAFPDYLLITYPHKPVPPEFKRLYPKSGDVLQSEITLINHNPIAVLSNGSYFDPADLLSIGFWAWWEKTATMLPFDFKPTVRR
jgi:hypothetical protein